MRYLKVTCWLLQISLKKNEFNFNLLAATRDELLLSPSTDASLAVQAAGCDLLPEPATGPGAIGFFFFFLNII